MSRVPPPRLDLLRMKQYAFGSVQFSRGCPFLCEFCDIIVMFGRRPRLKTAKQIIAELEILRAQKLVTVFIVDDNLIGNKKAIKEILAEVIVWQRANGYPLGFLTEATLDLADDDEMMRLMVEANINLVFVGIESPNEASLRETRKLQNVRAGGTMVDKVRRIQDAGIEVWAGMILGFDHDDATVFDAHREFISEARINIANVGMLSAIPSTPLYARLTAENRLDPADHPRYGTNVIPLRMTRETLSEGYAQLMASLYDPPAYFSRLDELYLTGKIPIDRGWQAYAAEHPWLWRVRNLNLWFGAFLGLAFILARIPDQSLRRVYLRECWRAVTVRRSALVTMIYVLRCATHYHLHRLVLALTARDRPLVNTF